MIQYRLQLFHGCKQPWKDTTKLLRLWLLSKVSPASAPSSPKTSLFNTRIDLTHVNLQKHWCAGFIILFLITILFFLYLLDGDQIFAMFHMKVLYRGRFGRVARIVQVPSTQAWNYFKRWNLAKFMGTSEWSILPTKKWSCRYNDLMSYVFWAANISMLDIWGRKWEIHFYSQLENAAL